MITSISEWMRTSDVRRWHTVNVTKEQTLAEHHALVAGISVALLFAVAKEDPDPFTVADTLMRALTHDSYEVIAGDVPSGMKPEKEPLDSIDAIVGVADSLEAYWWIYNNGAGSRKPEIVEFNFRKLKHRVAAAGSFTDAGKLTRVVNEMIMELGLTFTLP